MQQKKRFTKDKLADQRGSVLVLARAYMNFKMWSSNITARQKIKFDADFTYISEV